MLLPCLVLANATVFTTSAEVGCLMPHNTLTGLISGAWWTHVWQALLGFIVLSFYKEVEKNSRAQMTLETSNKMKNLSPLGYKTMRELGVVSWPPWAHPSLDFAKMCRIVLPCPSFPIPSFVPAVGLMHPGNGAHQAEPDKYSTQQKTAKKGKSFLIQIPDLTAKWLDNQGAQVMRWEYMIQGWVIPFRCGIIA